MKCLAVQNRIEQGDGNDLGSTFEITYEFGVAALALGL